MELDKGRLVELALALEDTKEWADFDDVALVGLR